jgi:hypothetical protein
MLLATRLGNADKVYTAPSSIKDQSLGAADSKAALSDVISVINLTPSNVYLEIMSV